MLLKQKADTEQAEKVSARIKALDYELMGICCDPKNGLTLRAIDRLARMHRQLRHLRHQIELEAGI
jgi:hypothetical protein